MIVISVYKQRGRSSLIASRKRTERVGIYIDRAHEESSTAIFKANAHFRFYSHMSLK